MLIGSQVYPVELLDFLVLVPHPHTGVPSTSKMNFLPLNPCPEVYFWGTLFVTTKVSLLSLACHRFNSLHSTYTFPILKISLSRWPCWLEHNPVHQKVGGLIPGRGVYGRQQIDVALSLSLPLFLSLPLRISKHILG